MEFVFVVNRDGPGAWVLELRPFWAGEPVLSLRCASKPDCDQAIEMIREAPVRYVRHDPKPHSLAEPDAEPYDGASPDATP